MVCPFCLHRKTKVYNSRPGSQLNVTWRRRQCLSCKRQFTTYESADPSAILAVRDGRELLPFSRAKLLASLTLACSSRKYDDNTLAYLCSNAEQKLYHLAAMQDGAPLTKDMIIATVAKLLQNFDPVAYVTYIGRYQADLGASDLRRALRKK